MTTDNTLDMEDAIRALKDRPSMEGELAQLREEVAATWATNRGMGEALQKAEAERDALRREAETQKQLMAECCALGFEGHAKIRGQFDFLIAENERLTIQHRVAALDAEGGRGRIEKAEARAERLEAAHKNDCADAYWHAVGLKLAGKSIHDLRMEFEGWYSKRAALADEGR